MLAALPTFRLFAQQRTEGTYAAWEQTEHPSAADGYFSLDDSYIGAVQSVGVTPPPLELTVTANAIIACRPTGRCSRYSSFHFAADGHLDDFSCNGVDVAARMMIWAEHPSQPTAISSDRAMVVADAGYITGDGDLTVIAEVKNPTSTALPIPNSPQTATYAALPGSNYQPGTFIAPAVLEPGAIAYTALRFPHGKFGGTLRLELPTVGVLTLGLPGPRVADFPATPQLLDAPF